MVIVGSALCNMFYLQRKKCVFFVFAKIKTLLTKDFNQYVQSDFTYTGFDLGHEDISSLVITQYYNDTIYSSLIKISKIKMQSTFSSFINKGNFSNVILYPIDYASGKSNMELQDNELLTCSSSISFVFTNIRPA